MILWYHPMQSLLPALYHPRLTLRYGPTQAALKTAYNCLMSSQPDVVQEAAAKMVARLEAKVPKYLCLRVLRCCMVVWY